jgi:micrococcal nuclease
MVPATKLSALVTAPVAVLVAALAQLSLSSPAAADPVETTALVLEIVDGDTIDIRDENRGHLRVRVLGIDSPETKKPGAPVDCWGPEATAFAESTLLGERVAVVTDPAQDRTDRYGRTLAYLVRADGWDYSVEAARAGAARSYIYGGTPVRRHDAIAAAEREARIAARGLWGPPCNGGTATITGVLDAPASRSTAPPAAFADIPPPVTSSVYYDDCKAARVSGAAPLHAGHPGYRAALDRDGDGVACER